jgi:hypothetical protein
VGSEGELLGRWQKASFRCVACHVGTGSVQGPESESAQGLGALPKGTGPWARTGYSRRSRRVSRETGSNMAAASPLP